MRHRGWILVTVLLAAGCGRADRDAWSGYAEADLVYLAPASAGLLQELKVERGTRVAAGDPLFALEDDAETFAIEAARERTRRAAAEFANLNKGKRVDEIRAIEQQLQQALAAQELSRAQERRAETLVMQNFYPPDRLDEARSARARDEARVRELQAQLAVARSAARPDEIAAADAERRALQADSAQANWRREQRRRSAPAAGVVFDVLYRPGEWVPAGAPVVALLPDGALKLRAYVPEAQLSQVAVGQAVRVTCDNCPPDLAARVSFVSPQAEYTPPVIYSNESRSKLVFLIEARPEAKTARELKPGQPVELQPQPRP